jgi:hypothetical protein
MMRPVFLHSWISDCVILCICRCYLGLSVCVCVSVCLDREEAGERESLTPYIHTYTDTHTNMCTFNKPRRKLQIDLSISMDTCMHLLLMCVYPKTKREGGRDTLLNTWMPVCI